APLPQRPAHRVRQDAAGAAHVLGHRGRAEGRLQRNELIHRELSQSDRVDPDRVSPQPRIRRETTMTRRLIGIATAIFLPSSCAYAQINALGGATPNSGIGGVFTPNSGIGTTSPLGLSTSGTAVAPTGIPLGATPLATPGVSSGSSNGVASGTACSPT